MPNLIGTGNNQVPTNGMLGGMAYQSPDSVVIKNLELSNLAGHNSLIPSTAVDVFVYDTRKDSDGGAWRYRTQSTSWYNETLNTATRGSRKEFPAVAVIVSTTTPEAVTIYDADDPDMPMWMVIPGATLDWANNIGNNSPSLSALNGILCIGTKNIGGAAGSGVVVLKFISDERLIIYSGGIGSGYQFIDKSISSRQNSSYIDGGSYAVITSATINDVAMTILPSAPIDSSTGLPIPTIAIGTASGTSIVKDDGTVVNGGQANISWRVNELFFDENNNLWACEGSDYSPGIQLMSVPPYSSVNSIGVGTSGYQLTTQITNTYGQNTSWPYVLGSFGATENNHAGGKNVIATSSRGGLTFISDNATNRSNSMVAYATTTYNTGWMHGAIRGAFLSDTSTASVTGTELVTNGNFSSSTGWNLGTNWTISGGIASHTSTAGYLTQFDVLTIGLYYAITFTCTGTVILPNGSGITPNNVTYTDGTYTHYGFAVNTNVQFYSNGTSTIDNVSVRRADPDRSVNNKGLQVFGTITKTPVATGSDLVAYSGFSASNYLFQPYDSALNFGTGDFSVMGWARSYANSASTQGIVFRGVQNSDYGFAIRRTTSSGATYVNSLWVQVNTSTLNDNSTSNGIANTTMSVGVWNHICVLRRSGVIYVYFNGNLVYSATNAGTLTPVTLSNGTLQFGTPNTTTNEMALSLWKISATAPSDAQLKRIYNDEKALFQENSKAAIYGSSNTVTALTYDDTTRLLHVGTSSGRSDFQGLRRINNTTTAVTTAISASNGLIAEQ